jgi:hypothetical protein
MRYKTLVHELLQDRYPALHERLRRERTLLMTLDRLAIELKDAHVAWRNRLRRASPGRDYGQIMSEALELAIEQLQAHLRSESEASDADATFNLDEAMASIRPPTPNA